MKFNVKSVAANALVIAAYVVVTFLTAPFSYGMVQFRFAEILCLLCFFKKDYIFGVTIGCAVANLASFSPLDILFGSLATILACLVIMFSKHLIFAVFMPVIFNGIIIGLELHFLLQEPLWIAMGAVALGELVVLLVGYVLFMALKKNDVFFKFIDAKQNREFKF